MVKSIIINKFDIIPIIGDDINDITINYNFYDTVYENTLIASTNKGVCFIAFGAEKKMLEELEMEYPKSKLIQGESEFQQLAILQIYNPEATPIPRIPLHIKGTQFQFAVWNQLLNIPFAQTSTYKKIAENIGKPKATRAVGSAVGSNPISYLIPCHRVVRSDGGAGGYHWGLDIKQKMLFHEGINIRYI